MIYTRFTSFYTIKSPCRAMNDSFGFNTKTSDMKKNLLISGLILSISSFMAFGFMNLSTDDGTQTGTSCNTTEDTEAIVLGPYIEKHPNFEFRVGFRFSNTISLESLRNAKSITDLIPDHEMESLSLFKDVRVAMLPNHYETEVAGDNHILSTEQLQLLHSADYTSSFYVKANCQNMNLETGALDDYELSYFISVTPEKRATYSLGNDRLIDYLKANNEQARNEIDWDRLGSGRIQFTVTKNGTVDDVELTLHTGHPHLDNTMIRLISKMPGKWHAAENASGEKVDQELSFYFGLPGC
mgnify:CR=1 FL=1